MNSDEESDTPYSPSSSEDDEEFQLILPKKRASKSAASKTATSKASKTAASKTATSKASKTVASKTAVSKASKTVASKGSKTSGCSKKRGSGADEIKDNCVKDLIVIEAVAKQEDAKLVTSEDKAITLERLVDKFMKDYYVDLQQGQTLDEAREVMTILVSYGLMIIDYNFGESHKVIEELEDMIKKGLFAKSSPINYFRRSKWFGSGYGNVKHNLAIVRESPMLRTFIENMLGMTGGVVANFFAQYYQPSITGKYGSLHGHLAYHQDKFYTHYRLLTTLGDSQFGKKMSFTICDGKPSVINPGRSVTINVPHGRTVLLPQYVAGVTDESKIWHRVYNCENTVTLCFEVFH